MSMHDLYKDDKELRALRERKLVVQQNLCSSLMELNGLLQEVNFCNDRIHSCVRKEVEAVTSLPNALLRHVTPRKTIKIKRTPACLDEKRLSSGSRESAVKPRKRREGEQSATNGHKKIHQHSPADSNRKLSKEGRAKSKTKHKSSASNDTKVQSISSTYLAPLVATDDGIHTLLTSSIEDSSLPASKNTDGGDSWMSKSPQPRSPHGASCKGKTPPTRIERMLGRKKRGEGRNYVDFAKMLNGESKKLVGRKSPPVLPNCQQSVLPPSKQKPVHQTLPTLTSTWTSNSKVVSKTRPVGFIPVSTNKTKLIANALNSGSRKHDIQLFAVLDTSVSPPLPRYVAKIVPESTAMLPLNNVVNPSVASNSTHSSSTNTTTDANSSTYLSTSSTTPCRSNSSYSSQTRYPTHSTPTHPIASSTHSKSNSTLSIATQTCSTLSKSDSTLSIASPTHSTSSCTRTTFIHQNPVNLVHSKTGVNLKSQSATGDKDTPQTLVHSKTGVNLKSQSATGDKDTPQTLVHSKTGVNLKSQSATGDRDTPQTLIIRLGDNKGSSSNPTFTCDHVGCTTSCDELQLLNLHKARVHGAVSNKKTAVFRCNPVKNAKTPSCHSNVSMQAPKKVDDKGVPSCEEKAREVKHANISQPAPQKIVSGDDKGFKAVGSIHANDGLPRFSQKVVSVGDKRVPSYDGKSACSNNGAQQGFQKTISVGKKRKHNSGDETDHKYMKLDFKLPSTPVYGTVATTRRNFARKSTGGSHPLKRRKITMKSLKLKLTKVSTKRLNILKRKPKHNLCSETLFMQPQPEQATLKQLLLNSRSTLDRCKYKNLELFRDHIRSQLNLPISDECISRKVESAPAGSMSDKRTPDSSCAPDEVCARVEPFCGNCARTKPFRTELRKMRDPAHVSHDSASPYSSVFSGASNLKTQSKDEIFPLVILPPVMHHQPTNVTEPKSPITVVPAKPLPWQTNAQQGFGSESPGIALVEASSYPQQVGESSAVMVPKDSVIKDMLVESSSLECEDVKSAVCTSTVSSADQNTGKLELVDVNKSPSSEYTLRLLETIAKLSGDVEGQRSRKSSVLSPPPVIEISSSSEDEVDEEPCASLVVSFDLSKLSRVPVPLPCPSLTEVGVVTNHLGSFTSQGVQVERGLILDKDVLESYLTVKVGEALYDLREKLERTERKVQEVMKEKDRLEKMLEMKVKLIKDLTTTGLKPVFVDKATMTDLVKDAPSVKVRQKARTTSTQTNLVGICEPPKGSLALNCLSQLSDKELDEYLRDSPDPPPLSEDDDAPSNEELPLSSKNQWMFEPSESARCSAFNMPVRFMRSLNQSVSGSEVASSEMVSLNLLSRKICHIFTKIQRINRQLQALPLEGILQDKVTLVTSSISHLLSHLPFAGGSKKEFVNDSMVLHGLSFGAAAYGAGWKIKELHSLLAGIDASKLPAYFRAELNKVTKDTKNALDFGITGVRNVTVNHTRQPLRTSEVDWFDFDLDDLLSSSDNDDIEEDSCLTSRDIVQVDVGTPNRSADLSNKARGSDVKKQEGHHRQKEYKEKIHSKGVCKHQLRLPKGVKNGSKLVSSKKLERVLKMGRNKLSNSKSSGRVSSATRRKLVTSLVVMSSGVRNTADASLSLPQQPPSQKPSTEIPKTTTTAQSGVHIVRLDPPPFITTSLPLTKNINLPAGNLSKSLKLLTSLASAMPQVSTSSSAPKSATTVIKSASMLSSTPTSTVLHSSTCLSSHPLKSTNNIVVSPTAHVLSKSNHMNVSTGRVEITNLSSTEFTPIMKAISPTSTSADTSSLASTNPKKRAVTATPVATVPQLSLPFPKHQGSTSTTFTSAGTKPKTCTVTATPVAIVPQLSLPFSKHQGSALAVSTTSTSAGSSSPASTTKPKACTGPVATIPQPILPFAGHQGSALAIAIAKQILHSQTSAVPSMPSVKTAQQPLILRRHNQPSPSFAQAHVPIASQMSSLLPLPMPSPSVTMPTSQPSSRMQQASAVSTPSIPTTSQSSLKDLSLMPSCPVSTLPCVPTLVSTLSDTSQAQLLTSAVQSLSSVSKSIPLIATPTPSVAMPNPLIAMPTPLVAMSTPLVATSTPLVATSTPLVATSTTRPHIQPTQHSKPTSHDAISSCITSSAPADQTPPTLEATAHHDRSLLVVSSPEMVPSPPNVMLEAGPNVNDATPSASSVGKTSTFTEVAPSASDGTAPSTSSVGVPLTPSKPTTSTCTEAAISVVTSSLQSVLKPSSVSVPEVAVTSSVNKSGVVLNAVAMEPSSLNLTSSTVATASSLPIATATPPVVVMATSQRTSKNVPSTSISSSSSVVLPGSSPSPPTAAVSSSTAVPKQSQASLTMLVTDSSSTKVPIVSEVSTSRCNGLPISTSTSVVSPSSTVAVPLTVANNSVTSPTLPLHPENFKNVFQDYIRQMHAERVSAALRQSSLSYLSALQNSTFGSKRSSAQKGLNVPATQAVFVNPVFQEMYMRALLRNMQFPSILTNSPMDMYMPNSSLSSVTNVSVSSLSAPTTSVSTSSTSVKDQSNSLPEIMAKSSSTPSTSEKDQSNSLPEIKAKNSSTQSSSEKQSNSLPEITAKTSGTPSTSEKDRSNSSSEIRGQTSLFTTTSLASSPAPSQSRRALPTSTTSQSVGVNNTSATTVTCPSVQELQPSMSTSMATDTTTSVAHAQQGSKDEPPCVNKPEASPTLPVSSAASNSCEPVSRCPKKQCDTTTTVSKDSSPSPKPTQPTSAPPLKATAGEEPEMEGKVAAQQAPSLSSKTGCVVSLAENTCAAMKVTQSSSLTSSLSRGSSATADCRYFLPGGVNPLDIIPVVQVFHDLKGVLVKWTFPTKYLHLQGGVKVYEIYAYITDCNREEVPPVSQTQWTKVGTIHPLKLPMAVTLNNILMTKRYSFSVRAVFDEPTQVASQFSRPGSLRVQ